MQLYEVDFQSPTLKRMAPKERSVWWVWISALCAGTVARAADQGQPSKDTGQSEHQGITVSPFTQMSERTDRNASWVTTNTATSAGEGLTTINTTVLITVKDIAGNKTRGSASHSVKYWVPPAFMVAALITLYFTYRRNTETESRSRAGSVTPSSDSDSQGNQAVHGAAHALPHPEAWNRIDEETPQAKESLSTEENAQALSDPDPSSGQSTAAPTADATEAPPAIPGRQTLAEPPSPSARNPRRNPRKS